MDRRNEAEASPRGARGASAAKRQFTDPTLRVFTASTEIPDTFPGASYFRARGCGTYHEVFRLSPDELAAAEKVVGSEVVRGIARLAASAMSVDRESPPG